MVKYQPIEAVERAMNRLGGQGAPFLFAIDFACRRGVVVRADQAADENLLYALPLGSNVSAEPPQGLAPLEFQRYPVGKSTYAEAFNAVQARMRAGEVSLINLTFPTPISINRTLRQIFSLANARYRFLCGDDFVVFSPECFVRLHGTTIHTYPMKGTIRADIPDAEHRILTSSKEQREHADAVRLLQEDLLRVARDVETVRYRYVEQVETNAGPLLQVSSELAGQVGEDWPSRVGTLMRRLLPGGSIAGFPRNAALSVIHTVEPTPRNFYSGVFGLFDGQSLDSGVMIRFIARQGNNFVYHSGGGVTINSTLDAEYQEMVDKVYVPFF